MHRTTIMLPADLKAKAQRRAKQMGISLGDLIRQALKEAVKKPGNGKAVDPLFADTAVYEGPGPTDLAINHDEYLYGDKRDFH